MEGECAVRLVCVFEVPGNRLVFSCGRAPNLLNAEVAAIYGAAKTIMVMVPAAGFSAASVVTWLQVKFAEKRHGPAAFRVSCAKVQASLFFHFTLLFKVKAILRRAKRRIRFVLI